MGNRKIQPDQNKRKKRCRKKGRKQGTKKRNKKEKNTEQQVNSKIRLIKINHISINSQPEMEFFLNFPGSCI